MCADFRGGAKQSHKMSCTRRCTFAENSASHIFSLTGFSRSAFAILCAEPEESIAEISRSAVRSLLEAAFLDR